MKDGGHISVFLAMAETEFLPANWEVNASFSIFSLIRSPAIGTYIHLLAFS